jgi:hypothetical protein
VEHRVAEVRAVELRLAEVCPDEVWRDRGLFPPRIPNLDALLEEFEML